MIPGLAGGGRTGVGPAVLFLLVVNANSAPIPPGALACGCKKRVLFERPAAADIAPGRIGKFKWFSGQWYAKDTPSLAHYATTSGVLALSLGGELVSTPLDFSKGLLPLLPGKEGFYVEFDVQLSDGDPDHWPAVWLMPVEHNGVADHYAGDPDGFERWMELDVDEGGFGPGLLGTVHSWMGIWPHFQNNQNPDNQSKQPLNRTRLHRFGASYDPVRSRVTWWVDGWKRLSAGLPYVPAVAARQHFYLLISAQSHGKQVPYTLFVSGVSAYLPDGSDIPAK